MPRFVSQRDCLMRIWRWCLSATEGVAIAEFAVSLPLLLVLVVGIFDFGAAFSVKQKTTGAAREGARFAASLPTSDLTDAGTPLSVGAVRDVVESYLQAAHLNDCGLGTSAAAPLGTLGWQYTASTSCAGTLTLTIKRGQVIPATGTGVPGTLDVVCSEVTISYPYAWEFNRVIGFLVPGATYAGNSLIKTDATVPNMD